MIIRPITDTYSVSPQIMPEDVSEIAAAGYKRVICNRPDAEVDLPIQAASIRAAVEAAGLDFEVLELTHQTMTPENIARQKALIESAPGPVLAYCASGTRCSVIWALGQAPYQTADDILATTAKAGYDLEGLRPTLKALRA